MLKRFTLAAIAATVLACNYVLPTPPAPEQPTVAKPIIEVWDQAIDAFALANIHFTTIETDSYLMSTDVNAPSHVVTCRVISNSPLLGSRKVEAQRGRVRITLRLREIEQNLTSVSLSISAYHPDADADCVETAATYRWIRQIVGI